LKTDQKVFDSSGESIPKPNDKRGELGRALSEETIGPPLQSGKRAETEGIEDNEKLKW